MALRIVVCILISFLAVPAIAHANDSVFDSEHRAWSVFSVNQSGDKVCYITSSPVAKTGNYKRRGEPYALVTYRGDNISEVSISSGYPYKKSSTVDMKVSDIHNFKLFTTEETPRIAWAKSAKDDKELIELMKRGTQLTAKGYSQLGTYSVDTYSLFGFTKAYKRMIELCGG